MRMNRVLPVSNVVIGCDPAGKTSGVSIYDAEMKTCQLMVISPTIVTEYDKTEGNSGFFDEAFAHAAHREGCFVWVYCETPQHGATWSRDVVNEAKGAFKSAVTAQYGKHNTLFFKDVQPRTWRKEVYGKGSFGKKKVDLKGLAISAAEALETVGNIDFTGCLCSDTAEAMLLSLAMYRVELGLPSSFFDVTRALAAEL